MKNECDHWKRGKKRGGDGERDGEREMGRERESERLRDEERDGESEKERGRGENYDISLNFMNNYAFKYVQSALLHRIYSVCGSKVICACVSCCI